MDQNQTLNSDLQKAIDDITNTTSIDPVFSDPVAAPSSVPDGDTGAMGEAVGPFPTPEPPVIQEQAQEVVAPPVSMPETAMPPMPEVNMSPVPPMPSVMEMPVAPIAHESVVAPQAPEVLPSMSDMVGNFDKAAPHNMRQVRESALRDLAPLLGHMTINPSQKFRIYRDMFEDLHDYAVLEPAYQAAKAIADEKERGEALLYLIESIDRI